MDEEEEPQPQPPPPARRALSWALLLGAGGAALWIAARPLDGIVPAPPAERPRPPAPPATTAPLPTLELAPDEAAAPLPADESAPPAVTLAPPPPPTDWFEETPGEQVEPSSRHEALVSRLQRQLAMNDLHGVRVEVAGDRVVTSGLVPQPGDRQRLALIVRSLAPDLMHEDHAEVAGGR